MGHSMVEPGAFGMLDVLFYAYGHFIRPGILLHNGLFVITACIQIIRYPSDHLDIWLELRFGLFHV
jgi:hypothetical protein